MEKYIDENYLAHYGVVGMRWGVRRYQNKDGSLTAAGKKRNAKELSRYAKQEAYKTDRPSSVINGLKSTISDKISDDDVKRVKDKYNKWIDMVRSEDRHEKEINAYSEKIAKKFYDDELKRNPDVYDTPKLKSKLFEYAKYEVGYDQAKKDHPEWFVDDAAYDKAWNDYRTETKKVVDKLVGKYGHIKIDTFSSGKASSIYLDSLIGDVVNSLADDYKY